MGAFPRAMEVGARDDPGWMEQMRFSEVGALGGLDLKRNASVSGSLARGGAEEMASQAPWAVGAVFEKEENGGLEEQV